MTAHSIKSSLLQFCQTYIRARRVKVEHVIKSIEESLLEEGKSTAGDKHHTGRAMLQIDRENAGKQLMEIERLEDVIGQIRLDGNFTTARLGSLVQTNTSTYFLSISAGITTLNEKTYICISTLSPIAQLLLGKVAGDSFSFRGNQQTILKIS